MNFASQEFIEAFEQDGMTGTCRRYSGRGMMGGRECFAIATPNVNDTVKDIVIMLLRAEHAKARGAIVSVMEDALNIVFAYSVDNMGKDKIIYWSFLQYPDTNEDENGEDE